ncbi:MAG TPA: hypothetical protein VL025_17020 [Thermoanaerobaculia bacterium]|nr:hypothetical protein [Thermoanaerobaculia bacterium]
MDNFLDHLVGMFEEAVIGKAENAVAPRAQVDVAVLVVRHLRRSFMNQSVELNNEAQPITTEVCDEWSDGKLAAELEPT